MGDTRKDCFRDSSVRTRGIEASVVMSGSGGTSHRGAFMRRSSGSRNRKGSLQPRSIVLHLLSFISVASAQIGQTVCACSPSVFMFTVNLGLDCSTNTVNASTPGINDLTCSTNPPIQGNPDEYFVKSVQFLEIDQTGVLLASRMVSNTIMNGGMVSYTSYIANNAPVPDGPYPVALEVGAMVQFGNDTIPSVFQSWILVYNNSCLYYPFLFQGNQIGWFEMTALSPPSSSWCPLAANAPTPTPNTPIPTFKPIGSPTRKPVRSKGPSTPRPTPGWAPSPLRMPTPHPIDHCPPTSKKSKKTKTKKSKKDPKSSGKLYWSHSIANSPSYYCSKSKMGPKGKGAPKGKGGKGAPSGKGKGAPSGKGKGKGAPTGKGKGAPTGKGKGKGAPSPTHSIPTHSIPSSYDAGDDDGSGNVAYDPSEENSKGATVSSTATDGTGSSATALYSGIAVGAFAIAFVAVVLVMQVRKKKHEGKDDIKGHHSTVTAGLTSANDDIQSAYLRDDITSHRMSRSCDVRSDTLSTVQDDATSSSHSVIIPLNSHSSSRGMSMDYQDEEEPQVRQSLIPQGPLPPGIGSARHDDDDDDDDDSIRFM